MNTDKQTTIDYQQALNNLPKSADYWKPDAGEYTIQFLDEIHMDAHREITFPGDLEPTRMWDVPIIVFDDNNPSDNGTHYQWSLAFGGENSKFGQVLKVGAAYGALKDRSARVIVMGKGKDVRYTITKIKE